MMYGCTLSMARPIHAKTTGLSLAKLVEHYGLGVKDQKILHDTKGKHLKDFSPAEIELMRKYNAEDVDQCYGLFRKLYKVTPREELKLIDQTIRMLTEPRFEVDVPLLCETLEKEKARKAAMLQELADRLGVDDPDEVETQLASAPKFKALLEALGVEVPMKPSPTDPDKQIPALAKSDEEFLALKDHPNEVVALAANARLGVKSTLLETRTSAFLEVADVCGGKMPIALNYAGADTTLRWGGAMKLNQQNLPRIDPKSPKLTDALRNCLKAPPGHKVVVADLSGIELRVNHFLWKVPSSMALYQASPDKADLYRAFAASMYNITPEEVSKNQRQMAKVAMLGLQFGAAAKTFVRIAKTMGGMDISLEDAEEVVGSWREQYAEITFGWKQTQASFNAILAGREQQIDPWGLCVTCKEGIRTPRGLIRYPGLRQVVHDGRKAWKYGEGRHETFLGGPKCVENGVQSLARHVLADNALEIKRRTGYNPAHLVHDEIVMVVPESEADSVLDHMLTTMRTPPTWWPELVVSAEGSIGDTYGAAK